ncbi:MAG: hypothetical protein QXO69_01725 [archaeon]
MQDRAKRAFVFTADAVMCLIIASFLIAGALNAEKEDLNDEVLYAEAQDIVETCTMLGDLTTCCFDAVKTEHVGYCLNDCADPMIKRDYVEFGLIVK